MEAGLKPGDFAPDFSLPGSDGKIYRLADFRGKQAVVLAWFPKAFTGGWTAECKSLGASGEGIKKLNVAYFTASVDSPEVNKKFAESLGGTYPILSDADKKVARAYGVVHGIRLWPERWTFYIGKDGRIVYIDQKIKVQTAGEDVVKRLHELKLE